MKVIKCDICGAEFNPEVEDSEITISRWDDDASPGECTLVVLDICPKCGNKIAKYIDELKKGDKSGIRANRKGRAVRKNP